MTTATDQRSRITFPLNVELLPGILTAVSCTMPTAQSQIVSVTVHDLGNVDTISRFDLGKRIFLDDLRFTDRRVIPRERCVALMEAICAKIAEHMREIGA